MKRIALFLAVVLMVAALSGCDLLSKLAKSPDKKSDFIKTEKPNKTENEIVLKYTYEYVKAEFSNGKLTLMFNSKETPSYFFDDCGLPNKEPLEISGFDGNYTYIMIGTIGQDINPIVFLITEEGNVEYYDIPGGIETGSYVKSGDIPLDEVNGIESLEEAQGEEDGGGYITVFAIDGNKNRYDLSKYVDFDIDVEFHPDTDPPVVKLEFPEISIFTRDVDNITDPSGTLTSRYELTLWSDNTMMLTEKVLTLGNYMYYLGSFEAVEGNFETGVLCEYKVKGTYPGSSEETKEYEGSFSIKAESDGSYTITAISGVLICDQPLGTPAKFENRSDVCLFAGEWRTKITSDGIVYVYALTITEDWEIIHGFGPERSEWMGVYEGSLTPIKQTGNGSECSFETKDMFDDNADKLTGVIKLRLINGNPERLELIVNSGYQMTPVDYGVATEFNPPPHYEE